MIGIKGVKVKDRSFRAYWPWNADFLKSWNEFPLLLYTDWLFSQMKKTLRSSDSSDFNLNWRHLISQICLKGQQAQFKQRRFTTSTKIKAIFSTLFIVNPIKGDISDSQLNVGGHFGPPPEINEGSPWSHILQKVILKHIRFMITCKISGPYLKNSLRYWDLKILR